MKKTCRQCGLFAEHYRSIPTGCKECWKARVKANRRANLEHYRSFDKERNKTPKRKAAFIAKQRRKRALIGPVYDRAHRAIANAIRKGSLIMPDHCSRCKIDCAPQAHHDDHSKPMDIMWLCPICHAARHVELGRLR